MLLLRGCPNCRHAVASLKSLVHTSLSSRGGAPKASMGMIVTGLDLPDRQRIQARVSKCGAGQGKRGGAALGEEQAFAGADKEVPSDLSTHSLEEVLC